MCVNLETSILAFGIGQASGLYLANSTNLEKKMIGLFVMFYSLVQLFEGLIYFNGYNSTNTSDWYSRLIMINLGFQGLVFFILMSQVQNINSTYILITGLISFFILGFSLSDDFQKADISKGCMKWNFLSQNDFILTILCIMYILIFFWFFTESKSDYISECGAVLGITFLLSKYFINSTNYPSIWCLSSAISAPIFTIL
jgi:hypothetical protein